MEMGDEMSFRVRSSKFRHVFGSAAKKEQSYDCIKITKNAHDSNFCAANPKFVAVVTESAGGGSFLVLPINKVGRVDINAPKVCGHAGPVLDVKWNPFDDNQIASCSDDATIKLWQIPDAGLRVNLTEWHTDLHGHTRRVGSIEWHPTAANILLSAGYDFKCILWNTETAEPINVIDVHTDTIFSIAWNRDGSLFATTSKDKTIKVINPRNGEIVSEGAGHGGSKSSKIVFIGKNRLFTTGFSRMSERQYALWDCHDLNKPLKMEMMDSSSGILFPYFDQDTNVVFLAGKGDGNIRYFEIVADAPYVHYLNQYQSSSPQRGLGMMPKRGITPTKCEIVRFYKLHAVKGLCEPISMIVPRKSEMFQEDIFPPTASACPSVSADEWISGQNREPILVSLKDGIVSNAPTITTYKAVKRNVAANPTLCISTGSSMYDNRLKRQNTAPVATVQPSAPSKLPSSLKNIRKLSVDNSYVTIENNNNVDEEKEIELEETPKKIEDLEKKPCVAVTKSMTRMSSINEPLEVDKKTWTQSYTNVNNNTPAHNGAFNQTVADISPTSSKHPSVSPNTEVDIISRSSVEKTPSTRKSKVKGQTVETASSTRLARKSIQKSPDKQNILRHQSTDTDESDISDLNATPSSSPHKARLKNLDSPLGSPLGWNSNPIYKTDDAVMTSALKKNSMLRVSLKPSLTKSKSFEPASSSSKPKSKIPLSQSKSENNFSARKKSSSGSPSVVLKSNKKTVKSANSSVLSQQHNKAASTESNNPPPPPSRRDSFKKARKNSLKLDTEGMLYGRKSISSKDNVSSRVPDKVKEREPQISSESDVSHLAKEVDSPVRIINSEISVMHSKNDQTGQSISSRSEMFSKPRKIDSPIQIVSTRSEVFPRSRSTDPPTASLSPRSEALSIDTAVHSVHTNGTEISSKHLAFDDNQEIVDSNADATSKGNYLDGFLMNAPDNTLIKPSKLRESMRKTRLRRAQTAPVDKNDVKEAMVEIERKYSKPERSNQLAHLSMADRIAFTKKKKVPTATLR